MPHGNCSRPGELRHGVVSSAARRGISDARFAHERTQEVRAAWRSPRHAVLKALILKSLVLFAVLLVEAFLSIIQIDVAALNECALDSSRRLQGVASCHDQCGVF